MKAYSGILTNLPINCPLRKKEATPIRQVRKQLIT